MGDKRVLNVNVGILGYIDSGKTSLGASVNAIARKPSRPPPTRVPPSTSADLSRPADAVHLFSIPPPSSSRPVHALLHGIAG